MSYPVIALSSWILPSLLKSVPERKIFTSAVIDKRFLEHKGPGKSNIGSTPLVRIFSFTQTTPNGELVAVVHDSTHKIVALFTREAVRGFETRYSQRLTYETVRRLFILTRASLRIINIHEDFSQFTRALIELSPYILKKNLLVMIEVYDVEMFSRDEHCVEATVDNKLQFVYEEPDYIKLFSNSPWDEFQVNADLDESASDDEFSRITTGGFKYD